MTPTGVRAKLVRERLQAVAEYVAALRALPLGSEQEFLADRRNSDAAESLLRRSLEALFDVARHLLSKGYGLGALEYRQVARLAAERGLIGDPQLAKRFGEMAGFRNRLTHFYREVTPEELYEVSSRHLGELEALAEELKRSAQRVAERRSRAQA